MTDEVSEPTEPNADLSTAQTSLEEILASMHVKATVEAKWGEPEEDDHGTPIYLDVRGEDLSFLLGRRGEILASLQYMTRTVVSKRLSKGVSLTVDVEGYRERRREQLRRMARRAAEQVVQRGKPMALEPMPAEERRIIHIELRDHPAVRTESTGEGNKRKVMIVLK
ncbi:MAG: KH domain-containing protein [Anaerolineales bacterium]|nr:KH domain-containing protein [Anaerolineales bacterium]